MKYLFEYQEALLETFFEPVQKEIINWRQVKEHVQKYHNGAFLNRECFIMAARPYMLGGYFRLRPKKLDEVPESFHAVAKLFFGDNYIEGQ